MQPNRIWVFSDLIERNRRIFKVPVYQRNYDWSAIECDKLYSDIVKAYKTDKRHFTGTVVYIASNMGSTLEEVLIIDGQQRLTTIYILLKTILDFSKELHISRVEEEITEVIFNRRCEETNKIKLKPIKSDNEQIKMLVENRFDEMDRNSHIYKNYEFFKVKIQESLDEGLELRDILEGIKKLEMVEIILDKSQGDEPQKIFESINSTGLELSLADLIRNYLLMDDTNQDELYERYWQPIEKNVGYSNLGDFVIHFLIGQLAKNVNSKNAYRAFKDHCEEKGLSHEDVLKELKRDSKYYGAINGTIPNAFNVKVMEKLKSFSSIKQTTINPLLFKVLKDFEDQKIDQETTINVLDYLLTYLIRITACEINKNLGKFMYSMYGRVIKDESSYDDYYMNFVSFLNNIRSNDRMPTDKEFIEALVCKPLYKKPICKFVLAAIENCSNERIETANLTIEHIMPQKENAVAWKREIGDDYGRVYETYLHTLGNLTITGYNSELGTKSFSEKKDIIRENSRAVVLNELVLDAEKWNEKSILKRARSLANKLVDIFDYVACEDEAVESVPMSGFVFSVNSDIDLSVSGLKPSGFTLLGEEIEAQTWSELYEKTIETLLDLDGKLMMLLASDNYKVDEIICISNDARLLNQAKQMGNSGIFLEGNLDAQKIILLIKSLLNDYGLDVEDFSYSLLNPPFDLNNESTWEEGMIKIALLFYKLFEDLVHKNIITSDEIENLKDKAYTKSLFHRSDYPALANNRTDNMGNSSHMRYRKEPVMYNGTPIYVSTQFFDDDREAIIDWYKNHIY